MNCTRMTLAITAIVAAAALATVAFAVPQQVMAYRHSHHNNNNSIKVDQQANQANFCSGQPPEVKRSTATTAESTTVCIIEGNNSADIGR
jgi:hypothetical protein